MRAVYTKAESYVFSAILLLWLTSLSISAFAQNMPLVIAWQAPLCTTDTSVNACMNDPQFQFYTNFVNYELSQVSGIGVAIPWAQIDECTANQMPNGQSAACEIWIPDNSDTQCPPNSNTYKYYYWCTLDQALLNYININLPGVLFAKKKIILIIGPTNDQNMNNKNFTPPYVFSQSWATAQNSSPQEVVVCSGWPGDIGGTSCPVKGTINSGDYAIWNVNGGPTVGCFTNNQTDLTCLSASQCKGGVVTDFSGFPVLYEKPFVAAYQQFLTALAYHYNPVTGSPNGKKIAPYIAYVRVGMANSGENLPACTNLGRIPQATWTASTYFPAGYIVNSGGSGGTQYVATGAGTTGQTMPTCSPAGCTTGRDGTIPGWYNGGPYSQTSTTTPVWPGPNGQFGQNAQPGGYWDNGYLTLWPPPPTSTGAPGYNASMMAFLKGLGASFLFDISSHTGPPFNGNTAYADSEAIIASTNGVGFGMQSVNVGDPQSYAAQNTSQYMFPTTREDWGHNFRAYPAPVHHLQEESPGGPYYAEEYYIVSITVNSVGTATILCASDCSMMGSPIYISGNSDNALNGIWSANCAIGTGGACVQDELQFPSGITTCPNNMPCGTGGDVFAPDYWPVTMPFAVQHGVTSIEVWECSLDYAFGAYPNNTTTTTWVPNEQSGPGCAEWAVTAPASTDKGYPNAVSDAQVGQPAGTSVRTGSILVNGSQF